MLDVRRLRLLSELSRRGTIAGVAKAVRYTPSAVSQSLAQLERDGRGVRLTPAAQGLVARTDRVLAESDAAEAELAAEHETVRGPLSIGAFPSAAAGLGVGLLPALACRGSEEVRFARIAPPSPQRRVSALLRRGAARRPALAATLDALRPQAG